MDTPPDDNTGSFLVIVYPQDTSSDALRQLAPSLLASLRDACGQDPVPLRPNMTAMCLLVHGRFGDICKAVDDVMDAYSRTLVVRVGTPFAAKGLSTAEQWLRRHR